ncbi:uncharacterized protein LOC133313708 [Gastrolobium bilobum]|uniref:uncharacterized protein LOC133313708 n=1 Tax=Gastrolobium bilobum TaxID=150636 RepID=UPI002AB293A2|nr:uncharacterized protein LOC133313708 [Gastrolobium bilobum]
MDRSLMPIPWEEAAKKVAEYVNENGEWKIEELSRWLPYEKIQTIQSHLPPNKLDGPDQLKWNIHSKGIVSVSGIYKLLDNHTSSTSERADVWKDIWKWKGSQRIKLFLWKVAHGKLPTKERMPSLNLGGPMCIMCNNGDETLMHSLRDCYFARKLWDGLAASTVWIVANRKENGVEHGTKEEILIHWKFPEMGWAKVNTDGAIKGNPGMAACGGVIRDCSELWRILKGMEMAWEVSWRKVIIESDSEVAITWLTQIGEPASESHIVTRIWAWMDKDWTVKLNHTYR